MEFKERRGGKVFAGLSNVNLPYDAPVFLPRSSHITKVLVIRVHKDCLHAGISHTLSALREKFWCAQGRRTVRRILVKNCFQCKKANSRPFQLPPMPSLPSERVNRARPFQHVGLDYAGPFQIKSGEGKVVKKWIVLFTCAVRAVHLESEYCGLLTCL